MIVIVYEVRVAVVFQTHDGRRETTHPYLFTAGSARDALLSAKRIADRTVASCLARCKGDISQGSRVDRDDQQWGHSLGSITLHSEEISGVGEDGRMCVVEGEERVGVVANVHLDWKCDHPGTFEQYIDSAVSEAAKRGPLV